MFCRLKFREGEILSFETSFEIFIWEGFHANLSCIPKLWRSSKHKENHKEQSDEAWKCLFLRL